MIKLDRESLPFTTFPNGELNFKKIEEWVEDGGHKDERVINFKYDSDADLIHLLLMARSPVFRTAPLHLDIMYMPYSRMDRGGYESSNCSLRTIGELIKAMDFDSIAICDPHSDLTLAYLGSNASAYYPFDRMQFNDDDIILFPDGGAQKRYAGMNCFKNYRQIVGNKVRDFKTGRIISYVVPEGEVTENRKVVIVDDLCSYGGTFKMAGDALAKYNHKGIELVVSHCEASIFKGKLFDQDSPITRITTTNSIIDDNAGHDNLFLKRIF